jgi:hypothetical protein
MAAVNRIGGSSSKSVKNLFIQSLQSQNKKSQPTSITNITKTNIKQIPKKSSKTPKIDIFA